LKLTLHVSGNEYIVEVQPADSLNKVLRVYLGLTGTKQACDYGGCGSCTVLLDGDPVYSCMVPAPRCGSKKIVTIECFENDSEVRTIQDSFVKNGAIQCGFCTPGIILAAKALIGKNSRPSLDEIRYGIAGNICRCTGYVKILNAIQEAAEKITLMREQRF
jgi:aerobic-type carbon monoxide dehydrogenase small subunit (CoxS/CutS family)